LGARLAAGTAILEGDTPETSLESLELEVVVQAAWVVVVVAAPERAGELTGSGG
jgi:hypothetical protein